MGVSNGQILAFCLCFVSYAAYHAARTGFAGVKAEMQSELGLSRRAIGNADTAFLIFYSAGQFFWGRMADIRPRAVLLVGNAAVALVLAAYTLLHAGGAAGFGLLAMRAIDGFMQATGWSTTVGIVGAWFGAGKRGLVFGLYVPCMVRAWMVCMHGACLVRARMVHAWDACMGACMDMLRVCIRYSACMNVGDIIGLASDSWFLGIQAITIGQDYVGHSI